jgi:hypothetical protein
MSKALKSHASVVSTHASAGCATAMCEAPYELRRTLAIRGQFADNSRTIRGQFVDNSWTIQGPSPDDTSGMALAFTKAWETTPNGQDDYCSFVGI